MATRGGGSPREVGACSREGRSIASIIVRSIGWPLECRNCDFKESASIFTSVIIVAAGPRELNIYGEYLVFSQVTRLLGLLSWRERQLVGSRYTIARHRDASLLYRLKEPH